MTENSKSAKRTVPEYKIKIVEELIELLNNKKTILFASIKNLPASQLQEISKKFRDKAIIKIPKKNLFFRALDSSNIDKENASVLKEHFKDSTAVLFSDIEGFELSADLLKNKSPAKAKPGQEAPEDIEVQAGPTDLMPGPAISELGALGIQVQIEKGKISIKAPKVIVKKGEKISNEAADVMSKLDIKPFSIGLIPLIILDKETNKVYLEIKINPEEAIKNIQEGYSKALAFAVEINYFSKETIKFLLSKASMHEKVLSSLIKETEIKETEKTEIKTKETSKESEEKSQEAQTPEVKQENFGEEK